MTDPGRVEQATHSFLDDQPEHEETVETLLAHKREHGSREFDDAPVDSGAFGELVSQPFVEKTDDGSYRFVDHDAVDTAFGNDSTGSERSTTTGLGFDFDVSLSSVDRRALGGLLGALALVVARSLFFRSVFQNGWIISPANDPYFFRSWQTELLARSSGPLDFGMFSMVGELTRIRPLTHALNWWLADRFNALALVTAFVPVSTSVVLGVSCARSSRNSPLTTDSRSLLSSSSR